MISSWGLKNFKSIKEASLEFAPLTVLTGTNSSGKSSLLQSILAISQTLAYKDTSRQLVLNGEMVRLGDFETILTSGAKDKTLAVEFTVEPEMSAFETEAIRKLILLGNIHFKENIHLEMTFNNGEHDVFPYLQDLSLHTLDDNKNIRSIMKIKRKKGDYDEIPASEMVSDMDNLALYQILPTKFNVIDYSIKLPLNNSYNKKQDIYKRHQIAEFECSMKHFLPSAVQFIVNEILEYARMVTKFLNDPLSPFSRSDMTLAQKHFLPFIGACADGISNKAEFIRKMRKNALALQDSLLRLREELSSEPTSKTNNNIETDKEDKKPNSEADQIGIAPVGWTVG
ncbi:hypothetical protein FACS1894109_17410 [Spirochaetia bacterium]|nr:hypothetical protein FACS1894109_17410 [Spirochaetia bacterium]